MGDNGGSSQIEVGYQNEPGNNDHLQCHNEIDVKVCAVWNLPRQLPHLVRAKTPLNSIDMFGKPLALLT